MVQILTYFESAADTPLTSPANIPTIRIRRVDTQALVVTDAAMTEMGDGLYAYDFTTVDGLDYSIRADGDPTAASQTTDGQRYRSGTVSGTTVARVEVDVPAILADTGTALPADIAALNDLSQADVQTALTAQGYTAGRAPNLDNLDAAVSSRSTLDGSGVQAALTAQGYTPARAANLDNLDAAVSDVVTDIAALNNLSSADIQAALTAQGYTSARAALLDNLDAAVSSVVADIAALNDISQADVQAALTAQGYTAGRAPGLDNLDATVSSRSSHTPADVDTQLSGTHGAGSWEDAGGGGGPSAADIADAVWDEALADHVAAGSTGAKLNALEEGILAAVAAQNDLSVADVQAALTAQGYTGARAVSLDNLDASVSSRSTLNQAGVQSALTAQGYTAARASLLDSLTNLDAAVSDVVADIAALNDLSSADVQAALDAQGLTAVRAALLDNLDATVSSRATVSAILAAALTSGDDVNTALSRLDDIDAASSSAAALESAVERIRKVTTNRVVVNATDSQVDVYEDDGTTIAFSFSVSSDRRERGVI